jgi:hypothetical protein
MVPAYISEALQRPKFDRAQAKLLTEIVETYEPAWLEVPYLDEAQFTATREQMRYYRSKSLLWENDLREEFIDMLHDSPAFGDPYDRASITWFFDNLDVQEHLPVAPPQPKRSFAHRAFGAALRRIRPPQVPPPRPLTVVAQTAVAGLNLKAQGLVHRHALWSTCQAISAKVRSARQV